MTERAWTLVALAWMFGPAVGWLARGLFSGPVMETAETEPKRMSRVVIEDMVDRLTDLPPALTERDIMDIVCKGECRDPWDTRGRAA